MGRGRLTVGEENPPIGSLRHVTQTVILGE